MIMFIPLNPGVHKLLKLTTHMYRRATTLQVIWFLKKPKICKISFLKMTVNEMVLSSPKMKSVLAMNMTWQKNKFKLPNRGNH